MVSDLYARCLRCNGFFNINAKSYPFCSDYCKKIEESKKPAKDPTKAEKIKFEMESYRF